jgi:hypothetical protein
MDFYVAQLGAADNIWLKLLLAVGYSRGIAERPVKAGMDP